MASYLFVFLILSQNITISISLSLSHILSLSLSFFRSVQRKNQQTHTGRNNIREDMANEISWIQLDAPDPCISFPQFRLVLSSSSYIGSLSLPPYTNILAPSASLNILTPSTFLCAQNTWSPYEQLLNSLLQWCENYPVHVEFVELDQK